MISLEEQIAADKYRQWTQKNDLRKKALDILSQLANDRLDDAEKFREMTISLLAVDKIMKDGSTDPEQDKKNSMKGVWLKWTIENKYKFDRVRLTDDDYRGFSGAVREFMDMEIDERTDQKVYYLSSLQYDVPAKPRPGEKAKPQTPDQLLKCKIYVREAYKFWATCASELDSRIEENHARGGSSVRSERAAKSAAEEKSDATNSSGVDEGSRKLRTESNYLYRISVGRMKEWLELDQDLLKDRAREDKKERAAEAKKQHESWLKNKDSLRIKLPTPEELALVMPKTESRMGYGREMSAVRPMGAGGAKTSIELMINSGAKYIHATDKRPHGDLDRAKKLLENIKKATAEKEVNDAKAKEVSERAFEQWTLLKDMRDKALKYIPLVEIPGVSLSTIGGGRGASASTRASTASTATSCTVSRRPPQQDPAVQRCLDVGKAMKRIDRGLFQEWCNLCSGVIPFNSAIALWDFFEPMACDVHSATFSATRDMFMKLLRPGVDYNAAFEAYYEKRMKRAAAESKEDDDKFEIALSKNEMKKFLRQLGFDIKPHELRVLIDAFDENGDGTITASEFAEFIGPKRDKKGGASAIISERCCWQTTCRRTGMANAFSVSVKPPKKALDDAKDSKTSSARGDEYDDKEFEDDANSETSGKVRTRLLKNGEMRVYFELKERIRREEILTKFGLLRSTSSGNAESKDDDNDDYGEDFEETATAKEKAKCAFISWTIEDRQAGLQYIMDLTKDARQEQLIKKLMSDGTPPRAPKLSLASLNDSRFRGDANAMTTELLLRWEPDQADDLVSFYSLEFAGPVGASNDFKEIFRDPSSAHPDIDFDMCYLVQDLAPGTSYSFRIRGFNGFGAGDFTYKIFQTRPAVPARPMITSLSSDSVTLRWTFNASFFKCLDELKRIFDRADADDSGGIDRSELNAIFLDKAESSQGIAQFLKRTQKVHNLNFDDGFDCLFDLIDDDDDGKLSWDSFEKFFLDLGWSGGTGGSVSASKSMTAASSNPSTTGLSYVVEQCSSEFDDSYIDILKTTAGSGVIHRLEPGKSYRFRVYAINASGVPGPKSDTIVVHTMLETPLAPTVTPLTASGMSTNPVGSRGISLVWKPRNAFTSSRDKKYQSKMMGQWTGSGGDSEEGVSAELAFQQYDKDGSGTIDASELAVLLEDLGVESTEERLRHAFEDLDRDGNGVISFEEFNAWWKKDEVIYTIKRSEPITSSISDGKVHTNVSVPIVCYRGERSRCDIHGLEPNSLYHFRLRYNGSRNNSQLSAPLVLMTAPSSLSSSPVLIRRGSKTAWIKWYAPPHGAFKFLVQLKVETSASSSLASSASATRGGITPGWNNVFNGPSTDWRSTTLTPDTTYSVRIIGVNCQGAQSDPSPVLRFKTLTRDEKEQLTPKNANENFVIECTNDICVGDTILITERLYEKSTSTPSENNASALLNTSTVVKRSSMAHGVSKSVVRMDMSVMSTSSRSSQMTTQLGAYLGERTIAAYVTMDNHKTLKKAHNSSSGDEQLSLAKLLKSRRLLLEVVWQKVSTDACRQFDLKPGVSVERSQSLLEQFEIYRCRWEQEEGRRPFKQEVEDLTDCFVSLNC